PQLGADGGALLLSFGGYPGVDGCSHRCASFGMWVGRVVAASSRTANPAASASSPGVGVRGPGWTGRADQFGAKDRFGGRPGDQSAPSAVGKPGPSNEIG